MCQHNICQANDQTTSSGGGISKGAVAGAIIGIVAFFAAAIFLFLRHRKRALVRRHRTSAREVKKDIPAPAETVLNRPDPTEKPPSDVGTVRVYSSHSSTTIDLDPNSQHSSHHEYPNPFADATSIQTAGTEATNVIPIAFVPSDSQRDSLARSEANSQSSSTGSHPQRPARSPELNLNLDHVNVSHDNLRTNNYNQSTRSGISGISSRNSYMSGASYSSDFLNEAPMIMTPTKGVRQVVGVVKAEVINAGSLSANNSADSLKPPAYSKPVSKSPLASTSFGPNDMLREEPEEGQEAAVDPFADKHISTQADYAGSATPSRTTFAAAQDAEEAIPEWDPKIPTQPWSRSVKDSRPSSMSTQAGSIVDIASATRVNVGLNGPKTPASANSYRTTMGRLVTPPTGATAGTLQEQQQRALAHAQAQAQAQGLDRRRLSNASALSATSTRADSILESFPFVPPSPISDRPIRSPPASPLAQQSFTNPSSSPLNQHTFVVAPPSPLTPQSFSSEATKLAFMDKDPLSQSLPAPPDRRTLLGLSTGSQLSTASSGLGSFPFQIESEHTTSDNGPPPTSFAHRARASLDTLALTNDLSSYPLGFDRDGSARPQKK